MLPPHVLDNVEARGDARQARRAARTRQISDAQRQARVRAQLGRGRHARETRGDAAAMWQQLLDQVRNIFHTRSAPKPRPGEDVSPHRRVYDGLTNRNDRDDQLVRTEDEPTSADQAVNEAYAGLGTVHGYYWDQHGRNGIDGAGEPLVAVVHYGDEYLNAFWDGSQMCFGDGDQELFESFTGCLDVIAHELTHGVIGATAGLYYQGQSGALNEHVADVFGALVEQWSRGVPARTADWLIGDKLLSPGVRGRGLRDMMHPGDAYDDDVLGKDPQPAHMRDFVVTDKDNGGVHINSGIPNRAFALAATTAGGNAWETLGPVWYRALTQPGLPRDADFAGFARATVQAAVALRDDRDELVTALSDAWREVGVL